MAKVRFNNGASLVSFQSKDGSVHFGVKPESGTVYKSGRHHDYKRWLWGRGTEPYDMCLEYFGLGPFLLLCWVP